MKFLIHKITITAGILALITGTQATLTAGERPALSSFRNDDIRKIIEQSAMLKCYSIYSDAFTLHILKTSPHLAGKGLLPGYMTAYLYYITQRRGKQGTPLNHYARLSLPKGTVALDYEAMLNSDTISGILDSMPVHNQTVDATHPTLGFNGTKPAMDYTTLVNPEKDLLHSTEDILRETARGKTLRMRGTGLGITGAIILALEARQRLKKTKDSDERQRTTTVCVVL